MSAAASGSGLAGNGTDEVRNFEPGLLRNAASRPTYARGLVAGIDFLGKPLLAVGDELAARAGTRRGTDRLSRGRAGETEGGKQDGTGEHERGDEFHLGISLLNVHSRMAFG